MNKTRTLVALILTAGLAILARPATTSHANQPVTVFLLRHAETVPETPATPERFLSATGKRRSKALQRLLGKAGITHVFSSDYPRTRGTIGPLAATAGLEVKLISPRRTREQVRAIRALAPGSIALVAGHSNTLPELIKALGGSIAGLTRRGWLVESDHDRLFMMTLSQGAAVQTIELRYGEASHRTPAARGPAAKVDPATVVIGATHNERQSAAVSFFSRQNDRFTVHGQFELTYGSPEWKASHGEAVAQAKAGTRLRLGDNFFATFDTSCAVDVGNGVLQPGVYYLALERGAGDDFALVFLDPQGIRGKKLNSNQTAATTGGIEAPMRWNRSAAPSDRLQITMNPAAQRGDRIELAVRFGPHKLETTLRAVLD